MTALKKKREKRYSMGPFSVKFGTMDKENPMSVYLEGSVFVSPTDDEEEMYRKRVKRISRSLNSLIGDFAKKEDRFGRKYIFIFELAESGLRMGKRSYMFFQAVLGQKADPPVDFLVLDERCRDDVRALVADVKKTIEDNAFEAFEARK